MVKAASDTKVQKVIGKKPPGKGRGRKSSKDKSGTQDKHDEVKDKSTEPKGHDVTPKEDQEDHTTPQNGDADGDLKTRWEACEPWICFRSHFL